VIIRNSSSLLKMKKILLILFAFQVLNVNSQTFDYQYDNNTGLEFFSDVLLLDSNYIFVGSDFSLDEFKKKSFIVKTDLEGIVEWERSLDAGENIDQEIHNVFYYDDTSFIADGIIIFNDTPDYSPRSIFLSKINSLSGDTIWTKLYGSDSLLESSTQTIRTLDGGFAMTGWWIDGDNPVWSNTILIKTDSLGNQEYLKEYTDNPNYDYMGRSLVQTPDSGFLILSEVRVPSWLDHIGLIKTDKHGNQEWIQYIPTQGNERFNNGFDIIDTDDGGYLIAGAKNFSFAPDTMRFAVHKIWSDGEIAWRKTYGGNAEAGFTEIIKSPDGSGFILAGLEYTYNTDNPRVSWGVMAKIDNDGCMLWKRNYQSAQDGVQSGKFNHIKATPDGGYIVVGTGRRDDSTFQNGWAIKTDEWGCVEPGCQYVVTSDCDGTTPIDEVIQKEVKIKIFPNPFNDIVTFDFGNSTSMKPTEIIVTDISGREVWRYQLLGEKQIEWTPNNLKKGLYFYLIIMSDGNTEEGKVIYIQ
jgi:hypothetical protein